MNIIMNSISEAHSNKRIMDFECLGFKNIVFGFTQKHHFSSKERHFNRDNFTYISQYYKRIITYINKKGFLTSSNKDEIWYFQGLNIAKS